MIPFKSLKKILSKYNCDGVAFFDEGGELIISYKLNVSTAKKLIDMVAVLVSISNNLGGHYICIKGEEGYISIIDCGELFVVLVSEKEIEIDTAMGFVRDSLSFEDCLGV